MGLTVCLLNLILSGMIIFSGLGTFQLGYGVGVEPIVYLFFLFTLVIFLVQLMFLLLLFLYKVHLGPV